MLTLLSLCSDLGTIWEQWEFEWHLALRLDPWGFDSVGTPGPKHQFAQYTVDGGIRSNNTVGFRSPTYLLSKRTSPMANLGSADQQGAVAGQPRTRTTAYEVRIKHNF